MKKRFNAVSRSPIPAKLKSVLIILFFANSFIVSAQKQIPLYPGPAPGSETWNWEERKFFVKVPFNANILYNVSKPSLLVFSPDKANGTAVIVCPGGGLQILNIENEGTKIANELVKKGVTVFVFKYRVLRSMTDDPWQELRIAMRNPDSIRRKNLAVVSEMAITDLNLAIRYIKQHANEFKIDSARIGLMGFSAGGVMTARVAYNFTPETKPAFAAPIYAVIGGIKDRAVKQDAPPLFIAAATDDSLASVSNSIELYNDWMNAKRPVELHIYSTGGHGLQSSVPSQNWILRFTEWLESQGFLKAM